MMSAAWAPLRVCSAAHEPVCAMHAAACRLMDIGAQTILVPMVDTAEQARTAARALRFPPEGTRGVAASTRAADFGHNTKYLVDANGQAMRRILCTRAVAQPLTGFASHATHVSTAAQACLIAQIESMQAVENIEAIAAVEGVDALFIGPSDLAGSMGHLGNPGAPEVQAAIETVRKW